MAHKRNLKCVSNSVRDNDKQFSEKFVFARLEEKGRLQFFFHSPSSELPIRDVLNEQKKGHKNTEA